jgi:hypothetical protein
MSENKSVFNWTSCQLLTEKRDCTKYLQAIIFPFQGRDEGERHGVLDPRAAGDGPLLRRHRV